MRDREGRDIRERDPRDDGRDIRDQRDREPRDRPVYDRDLGPPGRDARDLSTDRRERYPDDRFREDPR